MHLIQPTSPNLRWFISQLEMSLGITTSRKPSFLYFICWTPKKRIDIPLLCLHKTPWILLFHQLLHCFVTVWIFFFFGISPIKLWESWRPWQIVGRKRGKCEMGNWFQTCHMSWKSKQEVRQTRSYHLQEATPSQGWEDDRNHGATRAQGYLEERRTAAQFSQDREEGLRSILVFFLPPSTSR